jgi:phospholipase C
VVIYEENHSFDNLYGMWGSVNGQHVIGLSDADAAHTTQIAQNGSAYQCPEAVGRQPHLAVTARHDLRPETVTLGNGSLATYESHFTNAPYNIDTSFRLSHNVPDLDHLSASERDPERQRSSRRLHARPGAPLLPGAVPAQRRNQNRYVTGSDAVGMTMGYYDTTSCRSTSTCTRNGAPST